MTQCCFISRFVDLLEEEKKMLPQYDDLAEDKVISLSSVVWSCHIVYKFVLFFFVAIS